MKMQYKNVSVSGIYIYHRRANSNQDHPERKFGINFQGVDRPYGRPRYNFGNRLHCTGWYPFRPGGWSTLFPDEVRIQLSGRKSLYGNKVTDVRLGQFAQLPVGGYVEVPLKKSTSEQSVLWVTRGERWVTTVIRGVGRRQFLKVTNVSTQMLRLHEDTRIGMLLAKDQIPRTLGYVTSGSRRYAWWWNLAYEATTDQVDRQVDLMEED